MDLSFKQLEKVFAERFAIGEDRAVAFRARLQHLQRQGIPEGVNTGRGTRANYGWKQVIQLMVALDMIDLGLTPEVAIRRVKQNTDQLVATIRRVVLRFETQSKLEKAILNGRCSIGSTEFLLTSAGLLSYESERQGEGEFLVMIEGKAFYRRFTEDSAVEPMAAYLDLGARIMLVAHLVGREVHAGPRETAADLKQWLELRVNEDTLS